MPRRRRRADESTLLHRRPVLRVSRPPRAPVSPRARWPARGRRSCPPRPRRRPGHARQDLGRDGRQAREGLVRVPGKGATPMSPRRTRLGCSSTTASARSRSAAGRRRPGRRAVDRVEGHLHEHVDRPARGHARRGRAAATSSGRSTDSTTSAQRATEPPCCAAAARSCASAGRRPRPRDSSAWRAPPGRGSPPRR